MIQNLPAYVYVLFGFAVVTTIILFSSYIRRSALLTRNQQTAIVSGQFLWLALQAVLTLGNTYRSHLDRMPPRLLIFGLAPLLTLIALLFITVKGRAFIDSLPLKNVLWLNIVRIPVEIVLFWLFLEKVVPKGMTFDGGNLDILSGLTAPLAIFFGFRKGLVNRNLLLLWNVICLGLLMNIVIRAMLSIPYPTQKLAFDQPNIAAFYFPFNWLVTYIVPVVLFGHLVLIRRLLYWKKTNG